MIQRGLSTVLAILCSGIVLVWSLSYARSTITPQVIKAVRSYSVLGLTWARVENWRKDLGTPPCIWSVKQPLPLVGSFEVDCLVDSKVWMRFEVSLDRKLITPATSQTKARVEALTEWARARKRYP